MVSENVYRHSKSQTRSLKIPAMLFGGRKRSKSIKSDSFSLVFDLQISESHSFNSKVTNHPVEDGSPITDHIEKELRSGSASFFVSNYSLKIGELETNRVQDVYDLFKQLWKSKELVTLVTDLEVYEDVAITKISTSRNVGVGEAGTFEVSFTEFRIIRLKKISVDASIVITELETEESQQASPPVDVGSQSVHETPSYYEDRTYAEKSAPTIHYGGR